MSKLIVEVCKIEEIIKHPNADKLSIATVKGWHCIVGLNQYKMGDLVVYCPPDSVIPPNLIEKYKLEFLKKNGRVGTIKLRGAISQGLILDCPSDQMTEGQDVATELGIVKYEPPAPAYQQLQDKQPTKRRANPLFDKYTDIENIKNFNTVFQEGDEVVITEKVHGTNFRAGILPIYHRGIWNWIRRIIFKKTHEFVYGSHNVQLLPSREKKGFYGDEVYGKIAEKYKLADILPQDSTVFGEIYGKKIQELEYGMTDIDVVFFDVKYKDRYLDYIDFCAFCDLHHLPMAPKLFLGKVTTDTIRLCTEGESVLAATKGIKQLREGCVVKSVKEENHFRIGRKILKSVSEEYLAHQDRTDYH